VTAEPAPPKEKSLFKLIGDLPSLLGQLVRDEIQQIKKELIDKLKNAGIGIGLFVGAAIFAYFAFCVLLAAAVLGIATALPAWLSALIVGGALLVITAILALIGLSKVKKGVPPLPEDSIKSVKKDVKAIKGVGNYDR
jgi:hypothetical protein